MQQFYHRVNVALLKSRNSTKGKRISKTLSDLKKKQLPNRKPLQLNRIKYIWSLKQVLKFGSEQNFQALLTNAEGKLILNDLN